MKTKVPEFTKDIAEIGNNNITPVSGSIIERTKPTRIM
jgi:hypothetical protein